MTYGGKFQRIFHSKSYGRKHGDGGRDIKWVVRAKYMAADQHAAVIVTGVVRAMWEGLPTLAANETYKTSYATRIASGIALSKSSSPHDVHCCPLKLYLLSPW